MISTKFFILAVALGLLLSSAPPALGEEVMEGEVSVPASIRPTDLIVYLVNPPVASELPPPQKAVVMDQRNQTFHPHVLAIVRGTTVRFLNSDRVAHNIFSLSSPRSFDLGKVTPKTFSELTFEKPGVVEVLCAFHSRMLAYIHVMEHPYFAVPDAKGRFTINGVPPGSYLLRIWHEGFGEVSKKVEVAAGQSVPIQIRFPK